MWVWIVIGVLALAALWWFRRANELFLVSVRAGKVLLVRGRIPQGLLSSFQDVVQRSSVVRGSIRAVLDVRGAQLYAGGDIEEHQEQRLRNVFRTHPLAQLRAAPSVARPSLGQVLGIAWLAWLFDRSGSRGS